MAKTIYRLDLTKKELDEMKEKFGKEIVDKFKEIEITDKKIESMQKASLKKSELTRIKFLTALNELAEKDIDSSNYNLRKYNKISYKTSDKYFKLLDIAKNNIDKISSINEHPILDITKELTSDEICIYEFELYLLHRKFGKN